MSTDASGTTIGAALSQDQGKGTLPVAYYSKKLSKHQQKYSTTHQECIAVFMAVQHWRHFLLGQTTTVYTDHSALIQLLNYKDADGKFARMQLFLSEFDLVIKHRPGSLNVVPDALSRLDADEPFLLLMENENTQHYPEEFQKIIDYLRTASLPPALSHHERKNIKRLAAKYVLVNNVLYKRTKAIAPVRVIFTKEEQQQLMKQCHEGGAHLALKSCFDTLKTKVHWPSMYKDLREWIEACPICQSFGFPQPQTTVYQIPTQRLFQRFAFDYVGPLNVTPTGNRYIFVGTEYYSKWPIAFPVQSMDAVTTAKLIYSLVICQFGVPEIILTDQGLSFRNRLVEKLTSIMKIRHHLSSPYHPQCNGMVERFNKTLCTALAKLGHLDYWDQIHRPSPHDLSHAKTFRAGFQPI